MSEGQTRDSVQIATLIEDTVVDVADVDPAPGRPRMLAWFAAAAAVALGAALLALGRGVAIAAANERALAAWLAQGKDPLDFVAARVTWVLDLVVIFGAATALACTALAVAAWRARPRREFRVGAHAMLTAAGDGDVVFHKAPGMTGALEVGPLTTPVDLLAAATPFPRGARLRASLGAATYLVTHATLKGGGFTAWGSDRRVVPFALGSALAHALIVTLFFLIPDDTSGYATDELGYDLRSTRVMIKPPELPREQPDEKTGDAPGGVAVGAAAETGISGKMGSDKAKPEKGTASIEKRTNERTVARGEPPRDVRESGALGVIRRQSGFAALTGVGEVSSGVADRDVFAGYDGENHDASGGWGTGLDGDGPGGGGIALNTIGGNRYTIDRDGAMTGSRWVGPSGQPFARNRRPKGPIEIGTVQVAPGIDKNTIRRYVRQKMPQLAHCYERELVTKPTLAGTVTARWTIDRNGRVIAARADGMDSEVRGCVSGVISTIQFPAGEMIEVTAYPFHFRSAGQ